MKDRSCMIKVAITISFGSPNKTNSDVQGKCDTNSSCCKVSAEASSNFGLDRYIGSKGKVVVIYRFGARASARILYKEFGLTVDNLVATAKQVLE